MRLRAVSSVGDGPTHWAEWDGQGYVANEEAYRRTLVVQRSLRRDGWIVTPVARREVTEAMESQAFPPWSAVLSVLPFGRPKYPEFRLRILED